MSNTPAIHTNVQIGLSQFEIRPLQATDCLAYRVLRQRILNLGDGKYFSDSYQREQQLTSEYLWKDWCTEKHEHCIFGTFIDQTLIGVMMITQFGAIDSPIVEWEATWLDPSYREYGVARAAYEKVHQWTMAQNYKFVVVFIRTDNHRSQEIRKKQGFTYIGTKKNETWADGSIADMHAYSLAMEPADSNQTQRVATLQYLEDTLVLLNQDKDTIMPKPELSIRGTGR